MKYKTDLIATLDEYGINPKPFKTSSYYFDNIGKLI